MTGIVDRHLCAMIIREREIRIQNPISQRQDTHIRGEYLEFVAVSGEAGNQRDRLVDVLFGFAACQIHAVNDGCIRQETVYS